MVVDLVEPRHTDRMFHALADATRRDIVSVVLREPHTVSSLARRYPMSFAAVQKHVAVLERAGLVNKRRNGREQIVTGDPDTLALAHRALDHLELIWRTRMERAAALLVEPEEGDPE